VDNFLYPGAGRSDSEIVAAYLQEHEEMLARRPGEGAWASWHVSNLVFSGQHERALDLVLAAIRLAPAEASLLSLLGAGDLETLLSRWGADVFERVEAAARSEPKVAEALRSVRGSATSIADRLRALLEEAADDG
jgi:hypothetical protein